MLGTLRRRLIASHTLVLLVTIPLASIALIYAIETRVLLPEISTQLNEQVILVGEFTKDRPAVWTEEEAAEDLVLQLAPRLTADIALFDEEGRLLAASEPLAGHRLFEVGFLDEELFEEVSRQGTRIDIYYSRQPDADIAEVLTPVIGSDDTVVGFIYMARQLGSVYIDFVRLRNAIVVIMVGGLLLGTLVAVVLAVILERPIIRVIDTVNAFAAGENVAELEERGPTELRMLTRSFNMLTNRLRIMEENRRQLLSGVIHELSRPLGAMRAAIQTLQRGAVEDAAIQNELLAGVDGEVMRLNSLVENLDSLQDRILGILELQMQPINLAEWLPGILAPWVEEASEHGISLETWAAPDLPPVKADANRLAQIVGNLVSNAIKYTPPGGRVTVELRSDDDSVSLAVADSGPGISPDEQVRIFTPFFRGAAADLGSHGMGLGLAIARDLVNAHGGKMELESVPGKGSCFTVRLPRNGLPLD